MKIFVVTGGAGFIGRAILEIAYLNVWSFKERVIKQAGLLRKCMVNV